MSNASPTLEPARAGKEGRDELISSVIALAKQAIAAGVRFKPFGPMNEMSISDLYAVRARLTDGLRGNSGPCIFGGCVEACECSAALSPLEQMEAELPALLAAYDDAMYGTDDEAFDAANSALSAWYTRKREYLQEQRELVYGVQQ